MKESYHYPPEVFSLLVDTIPLLCRSKKDVVLFLRGAGVSEEDVAEIWELVCKTPNLVNKYEITRNILEKVNIRGDSGLRPRREIIKRVVEFEEFSICWPNDQLNAKGRVADLCKVVNVKDSFTRMRQERDKERQQVINQARTEHDRIVQKRVQIDDIRSRLNYLFSVEDKPQVRGKLLEGVLNDLFKAYGILIKEDFKRTPLDSTEFLVLEQVDGVIELDGVIHLVEMKWLKQPVGVSQFAPHLVRLFSRADARGIFISASEYTEPVIHECAGILNQKTIFLCSLKEFVFLLQREGDLIELLRIKSKAAILEKNPYLEILA